MSLDLNELVNNIKQWGNELGFQQVGICDIDLHQHEAHLQRWLNANYHGDMDWMARHGMMRARPHELLAGTIRVITVRMDYLPPNAQFAQTLKQPNKAYISRYALGRDYHKLLRQRLKQLGEKIAEVTGPFGHRPFVDSAPILERALAEKSGLGWQGKNSLILNEQAGSWFFLGELLIDLPLPIDEVIEPQCGRCRSCMTSCPTGAIIDEKVVDARRCISYLTIEFDGVIPEEFRTLMGNRIYGCDDCQLVCPFNRFSEITQEADFYCRPQLFQQDLLTLLNWDEKMFLKQTEGSPIRRIGHAKWQRNIIVALGNAPYDEKIVKSLNELPLIYDILLPHIEWALTQQDKNKTTQAERKTAQARLIRIIEKGLPRDA
jgi:epoxyqueuosine reductase